MLVYVAAVNGLGIPLAVPMSATGPAEPITAVMVILASIVPAVAATVLLAVLARVVGRPVRVFQIIALVFLLLSLVGPALQPVALSTKLVLLSMHAVAAAAIVGVLTRLTRQA